MLTTCPECRTSFRLSHAQLEARRGLVRCGHCHAVFNAYDALLPEFEAPEVGTVVPDEPSSGPASEPEGLVHPAPPLPGDEDDKTAPAWRDILPPYESPARAYDDDVVADIGDRGLPEPEDDAVVFDFSPQAEREMPQFEPPPVMPFPEVSRAGDSPDAILLSELPTREKTGSARRTARRVLYGLVGLFLALLLVGQLVYFFRAPLVDWMPELRPSLEAACDRLGCRVPLAANLSAIRVESSSLETDPEQASRATLRVSFSNRSRVAQQWPHFILRLTDWKGEALAQKAFRPRDYLPDGILPERPGLKPMGEQEFHLDLDLGDLGASGYEVFPRYP